MKKFEFTISSYGEILLKIENADESKILEAINNYKEPLPDDDYYKKILLELQIGESDLINWSINKGKLLSCLPKNRRVLELTRLA